MLSHDIVANKKQLLYREVLGLWLKFLGFTAL